MASCSKLKLYKHLVLYSTKTLFPCVCIIILLHICHAWRWRRWLSSKCPSKWCSHALNWLLWESLLSFWHAKVVFPSLAALLSFCRLFIRRFGGYFWGLSRRWSMMNQIPLLWVPVFFWFNAWSFCINLRWTCTWTCSWSLLRRLLGRFWRNFDREYRHRDRLASLFPTCCFSSSYLFLSRPNSWSFRACWLVWLCCRWSASKRLPVTLNLAQIAECSNNTWGESMVLGNFDHNLQAWQQISLLLQE